MTETNQQREGRVTAEIVLQQVINETEHEISKLYLMPKALMEMNRTYLEHKLKETKEALEWAKGRG